MLCKSGGGSFDSASLEPIRGCGGCRVTGRSTLDSTALNLSTDADGTVVGTGTTGSIGPDFLMNRGGGVSSLLPASNFAARDAVLKGRMVPCVDDEILCVGDAKLRVGELGISAAVEVPLVFSHDGGFCEALLFVD